ncbi:MAG TPA: hypothetical protein PKN80_08325 [bacterium]|uniref:V-type ATP synthase subunit F n=1 Tax=candidate division TA06 bacterium ADurb.Bin417 TaxID=1852828 RepID=A0A1V5MJQ3_UNCT6|nr:MAG: V-type ATP synthase subunit F [candidate division TA06 bacterium ADurb.Bin417]HNQ36051.1 hypothetical protein [bacterium]HNS48081.1 hypothetical protein [bacterium]
MRIAFIGEALAFEPFRALGHDVYPAADPESAVQVLERLDLGKYALVVLTPEVAAARNRFTGPLFLVLPGLEHRDSGQGRLLAEAIRRATGRSTI